MNEAILRDAETYTSAHRRKRRWYQIVTCLAGVVVFCTTYALILPAITMEKQCDIPEHNHTDICYTQVTCREKRNLTCAVEADVVVHRHDSACYDENGNLWCPLSEIEAHAHTESCYALPETDAPEVHTHTDDCYTVECGELTCTEHVHTDACCTETSTLICSLEESDGHRHEESCQDEAGEIVCGIEASEGHHHDGGCYETSRELSCGIDSDHSHTDACYEWEQVLSCDQPTDSAEDAQPVLVCTKPEIVLYRHTPDCFDADGNLICGKKEILEHQHTEACFETVEEPVDTGTLTCTDTAHVHTARCYGTWELVCGQEEHTHSEACTAVEPEEPVFCGKETHTHGEACYDENGELICTLEEHTHSEACTAVEPEEPVFCGKEPHTHGEACYDENGELICTLEEHTHSLACYSDPTADVETAEIWEQTFAEVELTGNWRQDAVSIAQTQLGYTESTKNYMVAEDGETVKGYTRYGAWYGDPYADWDAMFLTFCLHYAGVEDVPMDADCGSWATAWADGFVPAQSHEAAAGDLVFFDRDGDGAADHAGLVTEVTDSGFTAIEGDAEDAVRLLSYGVDDSTILGYVNLSEEFTLTAQTETGITVTITGESAFLPYPAREITVTVKEVTDEGIIAIRDRLLGEEAAEPDQSFLLDITLWHGEEEIEPTGPVTVTFSGFDTEGMYPKVYHIDTEAQTATDMEAEKEENGDVTVATDHFSLFQVRVLSVKDLSEYIGKNGNDVFKDGGNFRLIGDAWTEDNGFVANLTISKNTTIDLNGYILYISMSNQYFEVKNGATLTIIGKAAVSDSVSNNPEGKNRYGNPASWDGATNKLTYYKTTSTPQGTGTTEALEKHVVDLTSVGRIQYSDQLSDGSFPQVVLVRDGTLKIKGGLLRNNKGDHDVCVIESGKLTMEGGYLVGGGSGYTKGGGIYVDNGTVSISGGVIAANHANIGGGIYMKDGTLIISGGVISGNWTDNNGVTTETLDIGLGGGVFAIDSTVQIQGGYITNNSEYGTCAQNGLGCHGGGGIATTRGSLTMTDGYVTGNYSVEAGGGIYVGHFDSGTADFSMSGGTVAGNVAQYSEGGGIRISGGTYGTIRTSGKVYITNNCTNTTFDWGGGGIFVQKDGKLAVMDALIIDNRAVGFGGGVAACPSGETLIVNQDGAAIYGNEADGARMSGGGHDKNYDSTLAEVSTVFKDNGYTDYFCVRNKEGANDPISLVTGLMTGGGAANWTGSCDEKVVSIGESGYAAAKYLFGLVAHPNDTAKNSAVGAAKVIITRNYSGVHGGGIMTNGGLILGDPGDTKVVTATPALNITGTKALLKDGVNQNGRLDFKFELRDSTGTKVGEATSDPATGQFTISPKVQYSKEGTYTYKLSEVKGNQAGITYDTTVHTIQVEIAKKDVSLLSVTFTSYYVSSVTLDGNESGGSSGSGSGTGSQTGMFTVRYQNTNHWDNVYVYVWDAAENKIVGGWPGTPMTPDTTNDTYYYDLPVIGTGTYNFIFHNNSGTQTKDIYNVPYAPGKEAVFSAGGDVVPNSAATGSTETGGVSQGAQADGSYTLTIPEYAFTNTMTQLNLQITKKDSNDDDIVLEGAEFTLQEPETESPVKVVTTDKDGIATFTDIGRNTTYYLYETTPPENYMTAGPWILAVGSEDATLYPAREKPDGTLEKDGETGTHLTGTIVLTADIYDQPRGYELPNTGGAGTVPYTMGGCALIAVYLLLYSHTKRRKEDEASS